MYKSLNWIEDYIIYLTAEPDTILKRIIQRGSLEKWRKEWNEGEKEYLVKIMSHYNYFLKSEMSADKLFIVNTEDLTPEEALFEVLKILTDLSGSEFKKQIKQAATQMNLIKYLK
jgi:deoxyadenosine/deoxycytidine kinase